MFREKTPFEKFKQYFFSFFFFCFIGWIYEVVLEFIYGHGFVNRGFLWGPYLPVYGFGALLLIFALSGIMKKRLYWGKVLVTPFLVFVLVVLITTVVEYITGYVMELLFHQRWWDYSADFLNINGRVCPRTSFRFGLGGLVFLYVFQPLITALTDVLPQKTQTVLVAGIGGIMLIDLIQTLLRMA